jgi:hypothetical protein
MGLPASDATGQIMANKPFKWSGWGFCTLRDICTETGSVVPGLAGVPYKGFTDPYLELPAGLYDLKVTAAGSGCATLLFDIPVIKLDDGQVASVFAVGGANGFTPMVLTVPDLTPFRVFLALINK